MNKYQEALDEFVAFAHYEMDENYLEIYRNLLQELVDKETPLNLPLHHGVYMQCKCEAMNDVHSNYCWNCGQHIKLSETNE